MQMQLKGHYFSGMFHQENSSLLYEDRQSIKKYSPVDTTQLLWELNLNTPPLDQIVDSACLGFVQWKKFSLEQRIQSIRPLEKIFDRYSEKIAEAISLEVGKPYWESLTESKALSQKVKTTLDEASKLITDQTFKDIMPLTQGQIHYRPIGPCLVIGPFNFPCHLPNGQILSALLAGNSIIFKPSEKTIYSSQLLFEAISELNLPKGVVNFVAGASDVAAQLTKHPKIKGIFFTGSKDVGIKILSQTYNQLDKLVALELGGKNISTICEDACLSNASSEILKAAFLTSGQRCTATSIVLVHQKVVQKFVESFHTLAKRIIVDHPFEHESEPFMGPLVDEHSLKNYLNYLGIAKREGAQEIMRGKHLERKYPGYYVSPSIYLFESYNPQSVYLSNEIFGPSVAVVPFKDLDEAIEICSKSQYGLANSIFTQDEKKALTYSQEVDTGILNWNRSTVGASAKLPFGGIKNSGNYRPAGISMIKSCVYEKALLHYQVAAGLSMEDSVKDIKGLKP